MASSSDIYRVEKFMKERKFFLATSFALNSSLDAIVVDVPANLIDRVVSTGRTSRRQLDGIRKGVKKELGLDIIFLATSDGRDDLESGLRFLLKKRFPGAVLDCFVSTPFPSLAHVWLELSVVIADIAGLKNVISDYFSSVDMALGEVRVVGVSANLPSKTLILRAVKICSPASLELLRKELSSSGFEIPNSRWLQSKLDQLRKEGHLIWKNDSSYVVTEKGLEAIPLVKNRNGSDIARALAMARRKWND